MTYSAHLLPPNARPTAQDFAGLPNPEIIWEDARWCRFTERTDLHEVRYLEMRENGQAVALASLLITAKPGGLLFYDPPRLAGTAGALAEPELLDPSDQHRWAELTATLPAADQYPSLRHNTRANPLRPQPPRASDPHFAIGGSWSSPSATASCRSTTRCSSFCFRAGSSSTPRSRWRWFRSWAGNTFLTSCCTSRRQVRRGAPAAIRLTGVLSGALMAICWASSGAPATSATFPILTILVAVAGFSHRRIPESRPGSVRGTVAQAARARISARSVWVTGHKSRPDVLVVVLMPTGLVAVAGAGRSLRDRRPRLAHGGAPLSGRASGHCPHPSSAPTPNLSRLIHYGGRLVDGIGRDLPAGPAALPAPRHR